MSGIIETKPCASCMRRKGCRITEERSVIKVTVIEARVAAVGPRRAPRKNKDAGKKKERERKHSSRERSDN